MNHSHQLIIFHSNSLLSVNFIRIKCREIHLSIPNQKAQRLSVLDHPTQPLYSVCLQENCSRPYNCKDCKHGHPKDHPQIPQSLDSIYYDKSFTKYAKALDSSFSCQKIASIKDEMFLIIQNIEEDFRKTICKMVQIVEECCKELKGEVERRRDTIRAFDQLKDTLQDRSNEENLRELIKNYNLVGKHYRQPLDIDLERLALVLKKEVTNITYKAQNKLLSSLREGLMFKPLDFSKLEVEETAEIPQNNGVGHEALAYIAKWDVVAFGTRVSISSYNFVGLYNLAFRKTLSVTSFIHQAIINNLLWIDHKNYLLTGSDDSTIRIFRASNDGKTLQAIHKFRGYKDSVRTSQVHPRREHPCQCRTCHQHQTLEHSQLQEVWYNLH